MKVKEFRINQVILEPGDSYVTKEDMIISTELDTGVSVCLYDPQQGVVGMNHFLDFHPKYAMRINGNHQAGLYGVLSMQVMLKKMVELGAKRKNILAKIFGGETVSQRNFKNGAWTGIYNAEFINRYLEGKEIPLISTSIGGKSGRYIHFFTHNYNVSVKYIEPQKTSINTNCFSPTHILNKRNVFVA